MEGWEGVPRGSNKTTTLGWRPTCSHYDRLYRSEFTKARNERKRHQRDVSGDWWARVRKRAGLPHWETKEAVILDMFVGSGTTLQVARSLGRNGVGLDISAEYLQLARQRLELDKLDAWAGKETVADEDDNIEELPMFKELGKE